MQDQYKQIKKQLCITDVDVAKMFGYKNANAFRNSTRKDMIVKGVIELYGLINL